MFSFLSRYSARADGAVSGALAEVESSPPGQWQVTRSGCQIAGFVLCRVHSGFRAVGIMDTCAARGGQPVRSLGLLCWALSGIPI